MAVDDSFAAFAPVRLRLPSGAVAGSGLVLAAAALALPLDAFGQTEDGWRVAAKLTGHLAALLLVFVMMIGPLARLTGARQLMLLLRERRELGLCFAALYGAYLLTLAAPFAQAGRTLPPPLGPFVVVSALVLAAMAVTSNAASRRILGRAWHTLHRLGLYFFWTVFLLECVAYFSGPARPDGWYGVLVLLLVATFLLRFADCLVRRWRFGRRRDPAVVRRAGEGLRARLHSAHLAENVG